MAALTPPGFRDKRRILFGERSSDDERLRAAREFFDAERFGETMELLERIPDEELLSRVGEEAARRGDTFLLSRVEKVLGRELPVTTWLGAARSAEAKGRFLDAHRAYTRAGDAERAEAVRPASPPETASPRPETREP